MIKPWHDMISLAAPPEDSTPFNLYVVGGYKIKKGIVMEVGSEVRTPEGFGPGAVVYYGEEQAIEVDRESKLAFLSGNKVIAWEES